MKLPPIFLCLFLAITVVASLAANQHLEKQTVRLHRVLGSHHGRSARQQPAQQVQTGGFWHYLIRGQIFRAWSSLLQNKNNAYTTTRRKTSTMKSFHSRNDKDCSTMVIYFAS